MGNCLITRVYSPFTTCTLYGAASETISVYRDDTLLNSATTDSSGYAGSVTLKNGIYKFVGSVSNYEKIIYVDKDTNVVKVMPDGFVVYWYGYKISDVTFAGHYDGYNITTANLQTNYMNFYNSNSSYNRASGLYFNSTVDLTDYSKITSVVERNSRSIYGCMRISGSVPTSTGSGTFLADFEGNTNVKTSFDTNISSYSGDYYIFPLGCSRAGTGTAKIYAIYLS